MDASGGEEKAVEYTPAETLQREKEHLIRDITAEVDHVRRQLAVVNSNVAALLERQGEIDRLSDRWARFQTQCTQVVSRAQLTLKNKGFIRCLHFFAER